MSLLSENETEMICTQYHWIESMMLQISLLHIKNPENQSLIKHSKVF